MESDRRDKHNISEENIYEGNYVNQTTCHGEKQNIGTTNNWKGEDVEAIMRPPKLRVNKVFSQSISRNI